LKAHYKRIIEGCDADVSDGLQSAREELGALSTKIMQLNQAYMWATMAGLSDDMLKSLVAELKAAQVCKRELESALVRFEAKARQKLSLPEPEDLVAEILAIWESLTTLGDKQARLMLAEKVARFTEARLELFGAGFPGLC
jgi:hypothetical protein